MEGGCTSLFMAVGEYYNNLSCSALMMSPMVSSHPIANTLPPSNLQPLNRHSSMSPEELHRDKIMSHPYYHRLLAAYVNCQKIGAPPEMAARLEEAASAGACAAATMRGGGMESGDPALDQFMEAYCEMLIKYEQELSKPLTEATLFLARMEHQFQALTICLSDSEGAAEDEQLKGELLEKYRGCLGSLKQEFDKKKKKGKLPKEGRQKLLNWWSRHYMWPYPSEADKVALAESTGLEQKQINNWFINQRKRHWKPSNNTLD